MCRITNQYIRHLAFLDVFVECLLLDLAFRNPALSIVDPALSIIVQCCAVVAMMMSKVRMMAAVFRDKSVILL